MGLAGVKRLEFFTNTMTDLLIKALIGFGVFMLIVLGIKAKRGLGVSKLKISYKLVIEKEGQVTEEAFENFELMLERVKALETPTPEPVAPEAPVAPVAPAAPAPEAPVAPVEPPVV